MTVVETKPVAWRELIKLEPRLKELYEEISAIKDHGGEAFCANAVWYGYGSYREDGGFKSRLSQLVGWHAGRVDKRLKSMDAYSIAYDKLYNALPNCRNCNC
jgi:hypothetical protein